MAKVLFQNRWFEEIAPGSVYESEFESVVKAYASLLWPRFTAVKFKPTVYAGTDAAKPDFALIEQSYREWWVVEVEMSHHSLESHILPQIRILSEAAYGKNEAEKLNEACPELDVAKLAEMMKGSQPRVLVVVNKPKPEWIGPLSNHDAKLAIFESFLSDHNEYLFRVDGEHPIGPSQVITRCRFDALMTRWLVVDSPAGLGIAHQCKIQIIYRDHMTEWSRMDVSDKVWLMPTGPCPLPDTCDYEVVRRGDGQFLFQEIPKKTKRKL